MSFHIVVAAAPGQEFLPISSSAHLILPHELGGRTPDDLALDVAVHLGSIVAVVLYFWPDAHDTGRGGVSLLRGRLAAPGAQLAFSLAIATVPAVLVGAAIAVGGWADDLRDIRVVGWTMILSASCSGGSIASRRRRGRATPGRCGTPSSWASATG